MDKDTLMVIEIIRDIFARIKGDCFIQSKRGDTARSRILKLTEIINNNKEDK